jgi:NAD dependent epimerase/dehydratase
MTSATASLAAGYQQKRVLVTGAGGFIGSHLCEALVAAGARVTGLVRYNGRGDEGMLGAVPKSTRDGMTIVQGDIRDPFQVRALAEGQDVIFHLAALIAIPFSYLAPHSYVEVNIGGTLNVLEAARACRTPRVMHTSTSEVYGTARTTPISEDHPLQGQSPYSASKIGADAMVESYFRAFQLPVCTVRPFNTYGPRQSTRAVLPTIVTQALKGGVVRLGSLTPVRDMTYVLDTVRGMMKCALAESCLGEVTNLGTGVAWSVGQMVETVSRIVGRPLDVQLEEARVRPDKSEVKQLLSDNRRARARADWAPAVELEEGVRLLVEDVQREPARYAVDGYHV